MKKLTFEVKTLEEARLEAVKDFRVNEKYIKFDTTEKKSMLGLRKSYTVEAYVDVDVVKLGLETLEALFENMGVEATITVSTPSEQEIVYEVETEENPVLIGKNGKTLEGIQFYIRNLINVYTEDHKMVLVDIGGYKENRKKQLEILATKTAKEVARTKVPVKLTPMNAYERRIVHTKLADWRDVITKSEGENPNRYLVIKPKKK
ncbi:RNA-binding cell elongation regulator Jag/EloR [Liberiplasma polymorphum]|uniref:RNA-binding cell elongation regulator Jag/EloR n=1 Tax=Liberiplasma polymorphum TaxID=3374570 RepID=UPI00377153ED